MRIELMNCENLLMREIADKRIKRNSLALTYRLAMASSEEVDWLKVNRAIINRWSLSGLEYIKNRAWKLQ